MNSQSFNTLLYTIAKDPLKVIDSNISIKDYISIDLSSSNVALNSIDVSSSAAWEKYINAYLRNHQAAVAYGGYLEKRDIYKRSSNFNSTNEENERNVHLGIDLWSSTGTPVLAVLDGQIHSFQNNTAHGDYGPTIIMKHSFKGVEFYSLYGHLNAHSISTIKVGDSISQGQKIGALGDSSINGDYAPHLHFQLIKDIGVYAGDYPGVTNQKDFMFYKENCPDPNLLLKLS